MRKRAEEVYAGQAGYPESWKDQMDYGEIYELADRIESANKREHEATIEKYSAVGNMAKLREALEKTQSVIATCMEILNKIPDGCDYDGLVDEVADELCDLRESHVKDALSSPPRNCDVGTADEQAERYEKLCDSHTCGSRCSGSNCPLYDYDCSPFAWAQMPYDGGEVE